MKTGSVIAFPEKRLQGKNLEGLHTTRLCVNGEVCVGVPMSQLEEVCEILGMEKTSISRVETDYQDIYLAKFSIDAKEDQNAALRREYMKLCGCTRKAIQVKTLQSQMTKLQSDIERCQKQLVESLRKLEEKQQALQTAQGTDESFLSRFGDEFDQILKHPDLEKFEIKKNKIVVYTKPISISYRKTVYDIGRFKITISPDGSDGGVRMTNLTRVIDGRHHPHIEYGGVPCLGNIKEVIPHMIAEHKYYVVVTVCIQYLKSYEKSDSYSPFMTIENWPIKKGDEKNESD